MTELIRATRFEGASMAPLCLRALVTLCGSRYVQGYAFVINLKANFYEIFEHYPR
jgi:hypothetical protein